MYEILTEDELCILAAVEQGGLVSIDELHAAVRDVGVRLKARISLNNAVSHLVNSKHLVCIGRPSKESGFTQRNKPYQIAPKGSEALQRMKANFARFEKPKE